MIEIPPTGKPPSPPSSPTGYKTKSSLQKKDANNAFLIQSLLNDQITPKNSQNPPLPPRLQSKPDRRFFFFVSDESIRPSLVWRYTQIGKFFSPPIGYLLKWSILFSKTEKTYCLSKTNKKEQ